MNTIGNPELEHLFVDDSFKNRKNRSEWQKENKRYNVVVSVPSTGDIVDAEYLGIMGDQHIFSVPSYKDYIRVDNKASETKYLKNSSKGDIISVLISKVDNKNFYIRGSLVELYETMAHSNLMSLEEGEPVTVYIKSLNPAGYDVDIMRDNVVLPGFMPNTLAGVNKLHDPSCIIGETLDVMIESYSDSEGTYIVNRRKFLETLIPDAIKQLVVGEKYTGHVTGTKNFGAFVEFNGCLTGLIHKSNIHKDYRDKIQEIKPGTEIDFYVKEINDNRIILTQYLHDTSLDDINKGDEFDGKVKTVKAFGAIVSVNEYATGVISTADLKKSNTTLEDNQEVRVKVSSIKDGKMYLTLV